MIPHRQKGTKVKEFQMTQDEINALIKALETDVSFLDEEYNYDEDGDLDQDLFDSEEYVSDYNDGELF